MKRIVAMMAALLLLFAALPMMTSAAVILKEGTCGNSTAKWITWTFDDTGCLTISVDPSVLPYIQQGQVAVGYMKGYESYSPAPWADLYVTKVVVNEGVTGIGKYAFYEMTGIQQVELPDSLTYIGEYAFGGCSALEEVYLPKKVNLINDGAFTRCARLQRFIVSNENTTYAAADGVLFNADKTTLVQYPGGKKGAYTIPDSVTTLSDRAFYGAAGLSGVAFPAGVTTIPFYGFNYCTALTEVVLPETITKIGACAFADCYALARVVIPDSVTAIGFSAFENCRSLRDVTLSNQAATIDDGVFSGCRSLAHITIPEGVETLGGQAFYDCTKLVSISLPKSLTSIADTTFWQLFHFSDIQHVFYAGSEADWAAVTYPGEELDKATFHYNVTGDAVPTLTTKEPTCTEPGSVKWQYPGCKDVTVELDMLPHAGEEVEVVAPTCTKDGYTLYHCVACDTDYQDDVTDALGHTGNKVADHPATCTQYACTEYLCSVCKNTYYDDFDDAAEPEGHTLENGVCTVCGETGKWDGTLTENGMLISGCNGDDTALVFPETLEGYPVTGIDSWAFSGNTTITTVTIPNHITMVDYAAFRSCSSLTDIVVAEDHPTYKTVDGALLTKDGSMLIAYPAGKAGDYVVPDSVTYIERFAFSGAPNLQTVTIPATVTEMGYSAFLESPSAVIRGAWGSYAHRYATESAVPFAMMTEGMAYALGDVDGDGNVTANDALQALQAATGKITLNNDSAASANADGDDKITAGDALTVLQFATKKITDFPLKG